MKHLLLVIALASLWLLFLGCMAIFSDSIRFIDRTGCRDCSLLTYGLRWLRRVLRLDLYALARFKPFPPHPLVNGGR